MAVRDCLLSSLAVGLRVQLLVATASPASRSIQPPAAAEAHRPHRPPNSRSMCREFFWGRSVRFVFLLCSGSSRRNKMPISQSTSPWQLQETFSSAPIVETFCRRRGRLRRMYLSAPVAALQTKVGGRLYPPARRPSDASRRRCREFGHGTNRIETRRLPIASSPEVVQRPGS